MNDVEFAAPKPEAYNAFVGGIEIEEIQLVHVSGERKVPGEPTNIGYSLGGGFHMEGERLQLKYDVTASVLGADSVVLSEVKASVVVVLKMATPGTPECYNLFAGTSGALMVHPYLREVVQSTADRLGHPGLILPVAKAMPAMATTGD